MQIVDTAKKEYQARGDSRANVRNAVGGRIVSTELNSWVNTATESMASSLTWNHVSGIQRILVLDKTEAVHKLDFGYFTSAMLGEMGLDIGLGGCSGGQLCQR